MNQDNIIDVTVYRFDPTMDKESRYETYKVPLEKGMSILNVLNYIYENLDPTISYYYSCRIGKCTGCDILIDGKADYICSRVARGSMKLEPLPDFTVIKDLVIDKTKEKIPAKKVAKLMGR